MAARTARKNAQISARKRPKQARATELVGAILKAAIQVLAKEGAERFTMARVAAKAGVSVGSLYQYFPNKAAILFRLQSDEWRETTALMRSILEDASKTPPERVRVLVHAFIRSECDEARMRMALDEAAPLYRDAPEAQETRISGSQTLERFMEEALPSSSAAKRRQAGELVMSTLSAVGHQFSETPHSDAEIASYSDSVADMLCAYLERCERR